MMHKITLPFELKKAESNGHFTGWASKFGNVDLGDDIITKDVAVKVKTGQNGRLKLALYHDLTKMAGNASFEVTDEGIHVDAKLNLDVSYVKDAYALMKDGTLDEMSIGFNILDADIVKKDGRSIREIKSIELWEASIVPFGMNPEAQVTNIKSIREFEKGLRERMGFSRKQAETIATKGFKALDRDDQSDTVMVEQEVKKMLDTITKHFGE